MYKKDAHHSHVGIEHHGIRNVSSVHWNLSTPPLYEEAVRRREGLIAHLGPLVVRTGQYTGRSPQDKFIVREPASADSVWWGNVNRPMEQSQYEALRRRLLAYLQGKDLFIQDCFAGADRRYRLPLRIITETAWHSLFARNLFLLATPEELKAHVPQLTVLHAPNFQTTPEVDGTNSEACVVLHFGTGEILIAGTGYAGEIKKAIFSILNYLLPNRDVLPMHCSANVGPRGDVAIFFGLSGTGKTTLSTTSDRTLIGDDEHGWSDRGIFNFEGGCYAKVINLSQQAEPEIYETTRRFGTVLENVAIDMAARRLNLDDDSLTENTRAAYPISHLPHATRSGVATHPSNIFMLTADAFGVLPPVARLTLDQAVYYFLLGYTAKVAGTERGIVEPEATFSPCFGAPFMALHPAVYARMLRDRIERHGATVWLLNTGWTGGLYGVGRRINITHTRAIVRAALNGELAKAETTTDPVFGLHIPTACPDVSPEVLRPRDTWQDPAAYDEQASTLAGMFVQTFQRFADQVSPEVRKAEPTSW